MSSSVKTFEERGYLGEYAQIATKEYVTMADGSELLVYFSKAPEKNRSPYTLFLIPGWASLILAWDKFMIAAKEVFDIYYYESREKNSSKLNWDTNITLDTLSDDLVTIINHFQLDESKLILLSSSYGSIVLAHALAENKLNPFAPILFGPLSELEVPSRTRGLIKIAPAWLIQMLKPPIKWWLKHKKSEDKEQSAKLIRSFEEIDFKKNLYVVHNLIMKKFWHVYSQVANKVMIVSASTDKFHCTENIKKIQTSMKNSFDVDIGTNKRAHDKPMVKLILEYLQKFNKE